MNTFELFVLIGVAFTLTAWEVGRWVARSERVDAAKTAKTYRDAGLE